MTENVENEFENLNEEEAPEQEFSGVPEQSQENMIASGSAGTAYDYKQAPDGVKAPARIDLNGQIVTLNKFEIILPPKDREWQPTKAGTNFSKYCTVAAHYDKDGQVEYYSGVRVFKREGDLYSHPTITRDRNNQASNLLGIYADFKGKDINEVSLREFLAFLNSKPKVKIATKEVTNPTNNQTIKKNFIGEFVKE